MYRILDGRGTGKTSRLFLLAKEQNAWIVCFNPSIAESQAHAYGLDGINFISYRDFYNKRYPAGTKFLIDELEEYISLMSERNLIGYTLSTNDIIK